MKFSKDLLRFLAIPLVLLAGIIITTIVTIFFTTTTTTMDGKIVNSHWPRKFTMSFLEHLSFQEDEELPKISEEGKQILQQNGLWLQLLDEDGKEILSYDKPDEIQSFYHPYELLQLYQEGIKEYSVCIYDMEHSGTKYSYLIGFPLSISKVAMYVDTSRYNSGKILIVASIVLTAVTIIFLIYSYSIFTKQRVQDEKAKEEWLANITHDLKTPLAPIRGYSELLCDETSKPDPELSDKYGQIILRNTMYIEQLVDDLKMTYQLQSNMLPVKKEVHNISRFVKEIVISILNTPEYEGRYIEFKSDMEEMRFSFDPQLLKRCLVNIISNALKHNEADTEISVCVSSKAVNGKAGITLAVSDNGSGMNEEELNGLFNRYYRGTNTETKVEGSGLGMAIAKQIVEAHGGKITAQSRKQAGTSITIILPEN